MTKLLSPNVNENVDVREKNLAIEVKHMSYKTGRGKSAVPILHDINISIPEGVM